MNNIESYKVTTTAERLKTLMRLNNMKQIDIVNAAKPFCDKYGIKLGRNDISQYVSGKVAPNQHKLTLLALALNVSEVWLMGYNTSMERETIVTGKQNARLTECIQLFSLLNAVEQDLIIRQIRGLLNDK